jgi:hypothetical protein
MDTVTRSHFLCVFARALRILCVLCGLFAAASVGAEEKASHQVSPFAGSLSYGAPRAS